MRLYCDGACSGNHQTERATRRAGYGIYVAPCGAAPAVCVSHALDDADGDPPALRTSSRAELRGMLCALDMLLHGDLPAAPQPAAVVCCDSAYVVGACNEWRHRWRAAGWRNAAAADGMRAHADVLRPIDAALERLGARVAVRWTPAHKRAPPRDAPTDASDEARARAREIYADWYGNAMADALARRACGDDRPWRALRDAAPRPP